MITVILSDIQWQSSRYKCGLHDEATPNRDAVFEKYKKINKIYISNTFYL